MKRKLEILQLYSARIPKINILFIKSYYNEKSSVLDCFCQLAWSVKEFAQVIVGRYDFTVIMKQQTFCFW